MSPLQAARGMIVRDSKTGRRYEVLGLGRRPGTLRLLDLEKREVWYNASAQWYEPTGQRIEDVPLPEGEPETQHNHLAAGVYPNCPACDTVLPPIVQEALASETVQRRYERRDAEEVADHMSVREHEPEDSEY